MTNPDEEQETNGSMLERQVADEALVGQFDKPLQGRQLKVGVELFGAGPAALDAPLVPVSRALPNGIVQATGGRTHRLGDPAQALAEFF